MGFFPVFAFALSNPRYASTLVQVLLGHKLFQNDVMPELKQTRQVGCQLTKADVVVFTFVRAYAYGNW